ncbi:hypothetical protein MRS44_017837 [Fusarium solani]|uniref:uncharacterized protein n=1 Tax=Fusarium solani TaxID=169388 RepID=UPI0032C428C4|nr:hypothetical protein MRS44_017837 [Fusarium solani]
MRDPALPPRSAASRYPRSLIGEEAHLRFSAAYLGLENPESQGDAAQGPAQGYIPEPKASRKPDGLGLWVCAHILVPLLAFLIRARAAARVATRRRRRWHLPPPARPHPANLARGARAALLRNSSPIVNRPIGVLPAFGRAAQTPSSPLNGASYAAATEGAQRADFPGLPRPNSRSGDSHISILESANTLAREVGTYNAKLTLFQASFAETVSQGRHDLHGLMKQLRQRLQGQPAPLAPPPDDLRVFVRLEAEAPARNQIGYAIRTHISGKLGIDLGRIPDQATPLQTASKEESATAFHQWLSTVPQHTLIVYSDGSLSKDGTASYGFTIRQGDWSVLDGSGRLGSAEVFDAEATGALRGLQAALGHPDSATQGIVVCLDNLAAATRRRAKLNDGLKPSSGRSDSHKCSITIRVEAVNRRVTEED